LNHGSRVWRVGHASGPLEFPPLEVLSWSNRFDDPDRSFRTLYCAEQRLTAFRETLADFRPNAKVRGDYRDRFGEDLPAPEITPAWRQERVLAQGAIRVLQNKLVDIDHPALRRQFEQAHTDLLVRHRMDHLDVAQIRSKERPITQAVTRFVAQQGAAGIVYGSNLDDQPCAALFEGSSFLDPVPGTDPEPLTASHPDLSAVCKEFGLLLVD
jgi:hypothetical protein